MLQQWFHLLYVVGRYLVFHRQLSSSIPLSNEPLMKSLWTPMKRALAQVIIYQADVQDALKAAQRAVIQMTSRGDDNE